MVKTIKNKAAQDKSGQYKPNKQENDLCNLRFKQFVFHNIFQKPLHARISEKLTPSPFW